MTTALSVLSEMLAPVPLTWLRLLGRRNEVWPYARQGTGLAPKAFEACRSSVLVSKAGI